MMQPVNLKIILILHHIVQNVNRSVSQRKKISYFLKKGIENNSYIC